MDDEINQLRAALRAKETEALGYLRAVKSLQSACADQSQALRDVAVERHRQISVENWTLEHDDRHSLGELSAAATCYAAAASITANLGGKSWDHKPPFEGWAGIGWPWDAEWWKPGTTRQMLVKASALILAEIERIDRAALATSENKING